ncbi:hypothetical protein CLHUN_12470 [Ruminiclostridium hungatei]|uniref:Uncharacterized protein n=1 Tax=Ruminiclostridium hungatei TaxID=48256 RepID=A0A1V4SNH2_RUMHU|nr:LuxR family transcriptional regulator [Ruminiclostridium hungatei]OPX45015.1 hypothetical protein CLHUN_12470 [Ruminiclostridium hungatei]
MMTLQPVDEIFASWRRCMSSGVDNTTSVINAGINEEVFQTALNESKLLGTIFGDLGCDFDDLSINNNLAMLLVNSEGVLLKKNAVGS